MEKTKQRSLVVAPSFDWRKQNGLMLVVLRRENTTRSRIIASYCAKKIIHEIPVASCVKLSRRSKTKSQSCFIFCAKKTSPYAVETNSEGVMRVQVARQHLLQSLDDAAWSRTSSRSRRWRHTCEEQLMTCRCHAPCHPDPHTCPAYF